jgi:hypothetical protein
MALLKFRQDGPEPALRADEYAHCQGCDSDFSAYEIRRAYAGLAEPLWSVDYERAQCPSCLTLESFVRRRRQRKDATWAARWGEHAISAGVTPIANLLGDHLADLGLNATDLGLMTLYERRFRTCDDAAWDSFKTMAARAAMDEKTVRVRVNSWVRRGLWEKERRYRADGTRGADRHTRRGLTRALNLIGENIAVGREPTAGLDQLLPRLRTPRDKRPDDRTSRFRLAGVVN